MASPGSPGAGHSGSVQVCPPAGLACQALVSQPASQPAGNRGGGDRPGPEEGKEESAAGAGQGRSSPALRLPPRPAGRRPAPRPGPYRTPAAGRASCEAPRTSCPSASGRHGRGSPRPQTHSGLRTGRASPVEPRLHQHPDVADSPYTPAGEGTPFHCTPYPPKKENHQKTVRTLIPTPKCPGVSVTPGHNSRKTTQGVCGGGDGGLQI